MKGKMFVKIIEEGLQINICAVRKVFFFATLMLSNSGNVVHKAVNKKFKLTKQNIVTVVKMHYNCNNYRMQSTSQNMYNKKLQTTT